MQPAQVEAGPWVDTHAHPGRFFVRSLSAENPAAALADRGLADNEITSVLGGSFIRLFEAVAA